MDTCNVYLQRKRQKKCKNRLRLANELLSTITDWHVFTSQRVMYYCMRRRRNTTQHGRRTTMTTNTNHATSIIASFSHHRSPLPSGLASPTFRPFYAIPAYVNFHNFVNFSFSLSAAIYLSAFERRPTLRRSIIVLPFFV